MPDTKITALTALTAADPANDVLPIVDVSDTTMAASGTTKKISVNNILGCSGTATLASATITGDLTVDTSTLKVDSANNRVGIGTASPTRALSIVGSAAATYANINSGDNTSLVGILLGGTSTPSAGQLIYDNSANSLSFFTSGTTQATLNSTGLGVGASPANDKILSLGSMGILLSGATSDFSFRNSGGTAIQRLRYTDATGTLTIGSATGTSFPVELGGNTTTRAVTIDASSNVGVGVSPAVRFDSLVADAAECGRFRAASGWLRVHPYLNATDYCRVQAVNGTNTALIPLTLEGQTVRFNTNGGLAATLDASGNLLVGTTSAGGNRLNVQTASGDCTTLIRSQAANVNSAIDYVSNYGNHTIRKSGTAVWDFGVINDSSATPAFKISNASAVGVQLVSGATAWTTLSDETVKDIIEPISNAVAKVGSLRSVIGKFKTDSEGTRRSFLIAQDVKSVLPEAVDVVGENNELGLRYTEVIPLLVAAIKELTAEVNALKNA